MAFAVPLHSLLFVLLMVARPAIAVTLSPGPPAPQLGLALLSVTLGLLGLFAFGLWAHRRRERAYLLYALALGSLLLRNLGTLLPPVLGVPPEVWAGWALLPAVTALGIAIRQVLRQAGGRRVSWSRLGSRLELGPLMLGILLSLAVALQDLALLAGWIHRAEASLLPLAALCLGVGLLLTAQRRYLRVLDESEQAVAEFERRLVQQEIELRLQHESRRDADRQQALMSERQRLMQDMHDGLGSSLLSAMVAVEHGVMAQGAVVDVLRECVDDLRLVIDSLEPVAHDLVALLATMRYRLGKRLQAGGLVLEWDVQDLPMLEWLEAPDALHVLRVMQEALSNVLKHAQARRVRLVTRHHGRYVEIRVEDDGRGFDTSNAHRGRGLLSQQQRVRHLGGSLDIDSTPGQGSRLCLRLPVSRGSSESKAAR
ncbi:MAG TPA: ATP-binding protein [Burkholderiaceae bacterium]